MSNYVFIESRDPFESLDVRFVAETVTALRERETRGHGLSRAEWRPRLAPERPRLFPWTIITSRSHTPRR